jgi:3-hydroxyisobutyrate dehydrogenase-like beta-hydroxyacid dehydrogenase
MKIAFLGLGKMGSPMARRLLAAGHQVTVWNRTREKAEALVSQGAAVAAKPADAVASADAVLTMLFDDTAHEDVLFGSGGAIEGLKPGALHISLSTISVALSERLTAEHARRGHAYVGAPVFGRPNVAEEGRLWIVVAGTQSNISRARPLLQPLSRGISVIGSEPRQAHALKLGGNFLISAMIHSLSEAFVYSESQGIAPEVFLEAVNNALFQSPFYAAYGKVMLHPPKEAGATMALGAKDLRLLREAAASRRTRLSLAEDLAKLFEQAEQEGLGNEDWAVGQYLMAKRHATIRNGSSGPDGVAREHLTQLGNVER